MRRRWFSGRALLLHVLLVTIAPGCLFAGWWQVHRALNGNLLSYFYSVEWPIFAILAGVAWWQLVHDDRAGQELLSGAAGGGYSGGEEATDVGAGEGSPRWDVALETPELTAYNEYLKALSAGRGTKTWRNPLGLPDGERSEPVGSAGRAVSSISQRGTDAPMGPAGQPVAP